MITDHDSESESDKENWACDIDHGSESDNENWENCDSGGVKDEDDYIKSQRSYFLSQTGLSTAVGRKGSMPRFWQKPEHLDFESILLWVGDILERLALPRDLSWFHILLYFLKIRRRLYSTHEGHLLFWLLFFSEKIA